MQLLHGALAAVVQLLHAVLVLLLRVGQLLLAVFQLLPGIGELLLVLFQLLLAVDQLLIGVGQLPLGVFFRISELLLAVCDLLLRIGKRLLCVRERFLRVGQLLFLFVQRRARVGKLLLRVGRQPVSARLRERFGQRRDLRFGAVDARFIFVGIGLALPRLQAHVQLGLIVQIKHLRQDIYKTRQRAAADRGAAALIVGIQHALGDADDRKFPPCELLQRVIIVFLRDDDRGAEILFAVQHAVRQTFIRPLRQSARL